MEKLTTKLQSLQKHLEKILEGSDFHARSTVPSAWAPQLNPEAIQKLSKDLPLHQQARIVTSFSRLSMYFESGILLNQSRDKHGTPEAAFLKGRFYPLSPDELKIDFKIPSVQGPQVRKIKDKKILQQLMDMNIPVGQDRTFLSFHLNGEFIFIVGSELPAPWLKLLASDVFEGLKKTFLGSGKK